MRKLPLDQWVESVVDWVGSNLGVIFTLLSSIINGIVYAFSSLFHLLPPWLTILLIAALAYRLGRWRLALFTVIGLLLIWNLGFWDATMDTSALVLTASLVSIVLGVPLGISAARNRTVRSILTPLLDFMQTMPAFVYLIPAVTFFGLGVVPGVIASVIFAIPPTIRLTHLGIQQVPDDLVEAADSFGSTPTQKLLQVQLPLAMPNMMAGINQTIMLSLSMVVIASMIGAQGIGADVYRAVTQLNTGQGFEAGLAVVILAILLDRLSQKLVSNKRRSDSKGIRRFLWIGAAAVLVLIAASIYQNMSKESGGENEIGKLVDYRIIGIDPGSGLMKATSQAIQDYGLNNWTLVEGSGTAMTAALDRAYKNQEPIIVTGWTPHWMFIKYDLKYLDDPKQSFGGSEEIHTIVRQGLKTDAPSAYRFLDRFHWQPSDMEEVMNSISDGVTPEDAAAAWVKKHSDLVAEWTDGIPKANGQTLKLAYVAWDSEIASTNVVREVLATKLGYKPEMLQVEIGPMWVGIAGGDADAMVAAWLPTTSKDYYDKYKDRVVDLGSNLEGTKLGLVVPSYMNVDSIEQLR
ncbi:glycine betaine ABC transporter substrate-binding protein [Cohnella thailandensis]|uniref:ABC transporter permease subunit n=1 Tax=Cohnella thailandensis TaxID=557557 RepID=A0A841T4T7_9BACL|nr:glycine betaine ABC transporter substrate-binding protein [Cohnella thailandensis]MBB6636867.1 ABC transporter permease subunit [Cohnella thailandensis]MBP1973253.1 glycine betaine/proline transport system substrate-binding protein [Cohnella thailandensis]